jgi:hypothetical protein
MQFEHAVHFGPRLEGQVVIMEVNARTEELGRSNGNAAQRRHAQTDPRITRFNADANETICQESTIRTRNGNRRFLEVVGGRRVPR